jgi:hypothetical protein
MTDCPVPERAVLLIGATGRLGPYVADGLRRCRFHVVLVGRHSSAAGVHLTEVDVADRRWWNPAAWRSALEGAGVRYEDLAAVVNLVAGRDRDRTRSEAVGVGAVRALIAAAEAGVGPDVLTVHVGSVAELRPGRLTSYAAGKAAARWEARRRSVMVLLTVGVVPRRAGGREERLMRAVGRSIPEIAALPIAASTAEQVGQAVAYVVDTMRSQLTCRSATTEVVLAGSVRSLGDALGVSSRRRSWSRSAFWLLARMRASRQSGLSRVASWARLAAGREELNHYLTTASPVDPAPAWRLVPAGQKRLMLVPPQVALG